MACAAHGCRHPAGRPRRDLSQTGWVGSRSRSILGPTDTENMAGAGHSIDPLHDQGRMTMKITFVGHASALLGENGVGLLMDPWLKGEAFNESWTLYPAPLLSSEDWARVTHIWISHEHPDHLSIPTIKSIPAELRGKISVLFQKHYDTEILDWLKAQGFSKVQEMPHGTWVALSPGFQAACYQIGHMDSALAIKSQRHTILNLNDCETPIPTLKRMKRQLGHVDLLLDQFSIAGWPGNPQDVDRRRAAARQVLENFHKDIKG